MDGGSTIQYLNKHQIYWWDKFADSRGRLGKIYGHQIRNFNDNFDQMDYAIKEIKAGSRRAVISLWNPCDLMEQALPCCYTTIIFMVEGGYLNMHITFRSSDTFLGLPYDIIFGALTLSTIAKFCELKPKMLGLTLVDAHIYENHFIPVQQYFEAKIHKLPTYSTVSKQLLGYKHGPFIKAELNV